jgi:membrane-associated protease RseP (regulator of RpoE activity)
VTTALGVLAFVVGLLISVMLHELGHFATAKHYGMKATRFFLGFGPTIWSTRRGETEYGVKAIPAGGFVKIVGMTELEEIEPGDEDRAMWRFPARHRAVVLAAGSAMHFIVAALLCFGILATVGDEMSPRSTLTVGAVANCLSTRDRPVHCGSKDAVPAPAKGRLQIGDRIIAVNGTPVSTFAPVRSALRSSAGKRVVLTIDRAGVKTAVALTPQAVRIGHKTVGAVGISPTLTSEQVGIGDAFARTAGQFGAFLKATGKGLAALPGEVPKILRGEQRGPNDPGSVVDIARVSGNVTSAPHEPASQKLATVLIILAEVNFFVGVFNLLPLLPLDGGHLAILGFEKVRSAVYRQFGRRDPGRVDLMKIMPVTYAVVALFVGLSLLLLYAGFANPIQVQ